MRGGIDFLSFFVYTKMSSGYYMDKERVALIVKNIELLVEALKKELNDSAPSITEKYIEDYDEVFEEYGD